MYFQIKILVLLSAVFSTTQYELTDISSGRIETCRGCSLNRLPEVRDFVMNDAPQYERLEVEFISGAKPELVLLSAEETILERIPLSELSRFDCNQLLKEKGFQTRSASASAGEL